MIKKRRIALLFGGKSVEHEVSLLSAENVLKHLSASDKYDITLIGIDKQGEWHLVDEQEFLSLPPYPKRVEMLLKKEKSFLPALKNSEKIDVIFPILHGTHAEDGTIQGLLKLANIPFVGAGVLGSAIGMDKDVSKRLLREAGILVAPFKVVKRFEAVDLSKICQEFSLPLFVKPANSGSSIGVVKVKKEEELGPALDYAFQYDHKVLIEAFIQGREIECNIVGAQNPLISLPGEVIFKDEFHSYEAKYFSSAGTDFHLPATLSKEEVKKFQELTLKAYQVLCVEGMARVDFFYEASGKIFVNEINTIPGFTPLSMFPNLWEASGIPFSSILDMMIEAAIERHAHEAQLLTHYVVNDP